MSKYLKYTTRIFYNKCINYNKYQLLKRELFRNFHSIKTNRNNHHDLENNLKNQSIIEKRDNNLEDKVLSEKFSESPLLGFKSIPTKLHKSILTYFPFKRATKVQDKILSNWPIKKDVIVQAPTGSGKTLGYLIPSIEVMQRTLSPDEIEKGKQVSILIIAPTRELVLQISSVAKRLLKDLEFNVLPFIGGTARKEDLNRIINKRVDIVVATPGRVVDLISSSRIFRSQLQELKMLILDEADELISRGFLDNILTIIRNLPVERQTMMFSATIPHSLDNILMKKIFKDVESIIRIDAVPEMKKEAINLSKLNQRAIICSQNLHLHLIYGILKQYSTHTKSILFLPTVISVQIFGGLFAELGLEIFQIHGLLDQKERNEISASFSTSKGGILVTTDISARGMDYPDVGLVLQWGVPGSIEAYQHRIGRTARADKFGDSIMVLSSLEEAFLKKLRRRGFDISDLTVDDITKPKSQELHHLNLLCSKIRPTIMKQFFRSNLTYYMTLNNILHLSKKQVHSQVKNLVTSMGHLPPILNWDSLPKSIKDKLQQVEVASQLLVKKRGGPDFKKGI